MHHNFRQLRGTDDIVITGRADGIKSQTGEKIPGRHLAAVVIPTERGGLVPVLGGDDLMQQLRRLPRLTGIAIKVNDVMAWLVAVPVFADAAAQVVRGQRVGESLVRPAIK